MNSLSLAPHELDAFSRATAEQRDMAFALDRGFRELTRPYRTSLAALAARLGKGPLKDVYSRWKKEGILACLDKRCCAARSRRCASASVIEYWKGLQLEFQRGTALSACHTEFVNRWKSNRIPCLPSHCAIDASTGLPFGCSYRSLDRYKLTDYQAKAVRIGKHSASDLLPKVLSTRVGLLPGQVVEFDDQEHDVQVTFIGVNRAITRPMGFHTLDYLTGCDTLQSFKPTILNPDGTKQKLRQIDFEWFVVAYLTQIGYRADTGTEFIWELGTSKSSSAFLERMLRATNHKVSVRQSGLHREPALAGLFHGPAKGNPRVKGARECWFRLFREHSSFLLANTGKDRANAPEGLQALEREARALIAIMAALPPERAQLLQLPCLTWTQFVAAAQMIVDLINRRTSHRLEGWEALGHVTHEWRFHAQSPWLPQAQYLQLPEPEKQVFNGLLQGNPELWRTRKLSPLEVWEPRRRELTRVTGASVPLLFGPEHARSERVEKDMSIVVQDREICSDDIYYDAVLMNGRHLVRGQKYAVFLNPFAPERLEVCGEDMRWIGTAERVHRECKTDPEAAIRRYNHVRKIASEELAPIARIGAGITQRAADRYENNAKVGDLSRPFTAEEKEADARRQERTLSLDEMPDAPTKRARRNLDLDEAI